MNKRVLKWKLIGILIISIVGSLLHFVFDWAGKLPPIGAIAKAIGIYAIPIVIAIIFYSYTTIVGHSILVVDISSFIVAIAIGQLISYRILTSSQLPLWTNNLGVILLGLLAIAFIVFTDLPPHLPIFRDEPTGMYGII